MSTLMRSWIDAVVEEELPVAAECFKGKSLARGPVRSDRRLWDAHGLTIELHRGRHLQVLEIKENKQTCQAMVSDGTSLIPATFDRIATDSFEKLHGRAFKDCSRGSIISTKKYKLGSEGSPAFGKPKDILKQSGIQAVLSDIEGLFPPRSSVAPVSRPVSPVQSQVKNARSLSPVIATQAGFASQVPNLVPKKQTAATKSVDSERCLSERERFLSLLKRPNKNPVPILQDASNARPLSSASVTKSICKESVLSEASPDKVLGMNSKLEAKANSQRTHISSSQPTPSSTSKIFSPLPVDDKIDTGIHVASPDSEKENSQESAKRKNGFAAKPNAQLADEPKQSTGTASPKPRATQFVDQFPNGDIFEGLKRVPRKYVRMSKAQQSLLERSDAWFDPNTDPKKSYALIPPKVHEDLTRFINQKPALDLESQREQPESENDASESSSDSDIESRKGHVEDQLSDEEDKEQSPWSPSPERELLMKTSLNNDSQKPSSHKQRDIDTKTIDDEYDLEAGSVKEDAASPASLPAALRDGHEQNLPSRQIRRLPIMMSSSPTPEDELELDELHAVGDEVDDSLEAEQVPRTSQGVPSTALRNQRLVQVERTPDVRFYDDLHTRSSSDPVIMPRKRSKYGPTSSHLEETIPATCKEPTPRCSKTVPSSIESKSSISMNSIRKSVPSQLSNPENVQNAALDEDQESDEETMAQEQVFAEFQNSQPQSSEIIISSPFKPSVTMTDAEKSNVTKPKVNATSPHNHSPLKRSHRIASSPMTSPVRSDDRVFEEQTKMMRQNPELAMKRHQGEENAKDAAGNGGIRTRHEAIVSSPDRTEGSTRKQRIRTNLRAMSSPDSTGNQKVVPSVQVPEAQRTLHSKMLTVRTQPLKRNSDVPGFKNRQQLKKRRYAAAAAAIQSEQWSSRDTTEMIRAIRPSLASHSSGGRVEDSASLSKAPESVEPPDFYSATGSQLQMNTTKFSLPSSPPAVPPKSPVGEEPASSPKQHNPISVESKRGSDQSTPSGDPLPKKVELDEVIPWNGDTNIYTLFKAMYPNYPGSKGDFTWSLVYIEWLTKERDKLLPKSLFDDFIRVNVTEYKAYVHQPRPSNQQVITGYEFYNKIAKQGEFTKGLINYDNLQEALSSLDQDRVARYRKDFNQPRESKLSTLQDERAVAPEAHAEEAMEVMVTESSAHQNVLSPELGSTKYFRGPPRKPFFETFSQMPSANPRDTSLVDSPLREGLNTPTKSKDSGRRRTLPWQNASSPLLDQAPSSVTKRKRSSITPDPANHYKSLKTSAQARPTSHREASSPSPPNRHRNLKSSAKARPSSNRAEEASPSSPILGNNPERPAPPSTSTARTAQAASSSFQEPASVSTSARNPTKRSAQPASSPFHTPSLTALRSASSSSRASKEVDEVDKVKGWLDTQPLSEQLVPQQEQPFSQGPTSQQRPSSHQKQNPTPRQNPIPQQLPSSHQKPNQPHQQQAKSSPHPTPQAQAQAQPSPNPPPCTQQPLQNPNPKPTPTPRPTPHEPPIPQPNPTHASTPQLQTPGPKSVSNFRAYLKKQNIDGHLTSRSSTPGSARGKGVACGSGSGSANASREGKGKATKKSMEYAEPMTQGWEFD